MTIGIENIEEDNNRLQLLLVDLSKKYSKKDILVLLRKSNKTEFISETDSTINIGGLTLSFDNSDRLTKIVQQ